MPLCFPYPYPDRDSLFFGLTSAYLAARLHCSEQYLTSDQFLAQALRHVISRPHFTHSLLGRLDLLPLKRVGEDWGFVAMHA